MLPVGFSSATLVPPTPQPQPRVSSRALDGDSARRLPGADWVCEVRRRRFRKASPSTDAGGRRLRKASPSTDAAGRRLRKASPSTEAAVAGFEKLLGAT